jgi:hypothetical protein
MKKKVYVGKRREGSQKKKKKKEENKKRRQRETPYTLLKFIDVSTELIASIKFEVIRSNQQAEDVERATIRHVTGRCSLLASSAYTPILKMEAMFLRTSTRLHRVMSLKVAFIIVTAMGISDITRKNKLEVLGRTNRLLSFDTTRSA